jgi:hypothetical protein
MLSGGDADMLFMFRYNAVPLQRKGVTVAAERVDVSMLQGQKVGDAVQLGESDYAIITKIDKDSAVVQRVVSRETGHIPAVQNRNLTYASRGRVEKKVNDGFVAFEEGQVGLPGTLKYEELQEDITDQGTLAGIKKGFDGVTDWFFGRLYAGVTTKLDRSPVFRQAYYRAVDAQLGRLTPQEAVKLVDSIKDGAAKIDYTPERYIGDKALWKRIVAKSKEGVDDRPDLSDMLFHGTSKPLASGRFEKIDEIYLPDAENLFGRGVYLTDSPDVAASYTKKGALRSSRKKVRGITVGQQGMVYGVKISDTARILDLTQPNESVRQKILEIISENWFQRENVVGTDELENLLRGGGPFGAADVPPAENLIAAFKDSMDGMPLEVADEAMRSLTDELAKSADVLSYRGGVRAGGFGEHNAFVVLNTDVLNMTRSDKVAEFLDVVSAAKMKPSVTIQDLDDYAKWVALDEVKGLLYNAAARNNLEDALRIVAPFAVAWREILGTYADFAMSNPINTYRQFQRVYTGLEGADPENDGRGFIYADPVTKQTMFSFPMSGLVARAFAGTPGFLEAPVGQLSAGMSVIPALGPYGQIAVSQLPDNPSYDDIINFLLPYGRTENGGILFNITPGWINKANQALRADTRDHATMFYNTYIDTVRAKAASGNYDLSNMADKERLLADSEKAARVLMMMRAASQFFGPTSASVEFQVPTSQGDQYVSALSQEFYKMQAEDYDTAIQRFLETFGDDAFVYVASKTRSLRDGLEATEEFGDWERRNQPLLAEYPDVAAYLAPAGSDFNFAVWQRQLLSGEREKLSDREVLLLAQERVGAAKYRAMRLQAGQYPTDEVRDWLRQYRQQLSKQYPGFPEVARFEVGKFPAQMQQLEAMVADPRAEGNVVAGALQKYLGVRNELIARARAAGYVANDLKQTKALQAFRDYLASYGNTLILETPEFGRIYDRLLAQEVEF